jgi:hypothetical protein
MASVLNFIVRLIFVLALAVMLFGLLAVGLVVGLLWWLAALLTGRKRPAARVWVNRFQEQAQQGMRRANKGREQGEVVDAQVRELP